MHCIMTLWQAAKSQLVAFHGKKNEELQKQRDKIVPTQYLINAVSVQGEDRSQG